MTIAKKASISMFPYANLSERTTVVVLYIDFMVVSSFSSYYSTSCVNDTWHKAC